jgi:hypothetical protein
MPRAQNRIRHVTEAVSLRIGGVQNRDHVRPSIGARCGVRQEDEQSSCCARDEGGPFGAALQGEASSRHELLQPKAAVVSVVEKAWQ